MAEGRRGRGKRSGGRWSDQPRSRVEVIGSWVGSAWARRRPSIVNLLPCRGRLTPEGLSEGPLRYAQAPLGSWLSCGGESHLDGLVSEVLKMWSEDRELAVGRYDEVVPEEDERLGLDEGELDRLAYLAEHPELADPLIWFLPERKPEDRGEEE